MLNVRMKERGCRAGCGRAAQQSVGMREVVEETSIPTRMNYTIYIFARERQTYGVIIITLHLWGWS